MLAVHFFSKRIRTQITLPYQWLNITFNGIRSSSSSTSDSSSSDSDSDSARGNDNKKKLNIDYLNSAKVAHKRRQIEKELAKTALLLSNSMVKDKSKILTELLSNISNIQNETTSLESKSTKDQNKVRDKVNLKYEEESVAEESSTERILQDQREMLRYINDNDEMEKETFREQSTMKKPKERREMLRLIDDNVETEEGTFREKSIRKKPKERREMLRLIDDNVETEEETSRKQSIRKKPKERREMLRLIDDNVEMEEEISREQSIRKKPKERREMLKLIDDNVEREREISREQSIRKKPKERKEMWGHIDNNVEAEQEITQRSSITNMLLKNKRASKMLESLKRRTERIDNDIEIKKNTSKISERSLTSKLRAQTKNFDDIDDHLDTKYATRSLQESSSLIMSLKKKQKMQSGFIKYQEIGLPHKEIFVKESLKDPNVPKFKVWDTFNEQELQSSLMTYPENALQEMIKWTKEGKLWKFPIDNEQGMEEEQSVHFSKHVFLERHLAPWCPSKGPLRHFMELVCVGLSKNPYMTIEEKYDHIMWYKDFFKDKQDLLGKLGLVE